MWSAFDTVLMVRCRDLHAEQIGADVNTITQLLHRACWGSFRLSVDDAASVLAKLEQSPDKCLLLLDGLDELPEPKDACWRDVLVQLFELPFKKLVTSRPYAVGKLPDWISHEGLVEISGFTDSNVAVYFEKVLGQSNETEEFIQSVKKNSDLWAITHIPIHAYLLKSWWVTSGSQAGHVLLATLSISDLYASLIVDVCRRYLAKTGTLNGSELVDDEVVLNDPRVHRLLDTLGRWAFEGLRQDSAQLPMSWLSGIQGSDEKPTLLSTSQCEQLEMDYLKKVGLLKEVGSHIGAQQRFEFLHLSFQEFLAANVIAVTLRQGEKAEKTHLTQVIHRYKYYLNFTLVWPSVAGLLRRCPTALNDFLSILITGPKDWVGFVEADLLMRCLESSLPASPDTKTLGLAQRALLRAVKQRIKRFNKLPHAWQGATIETLSMCPRLIRLNADTVWAILRDEKVDHYVRSKLVSSAVAHWSPTPALVAAVWAFLRDEKVDHYVRRSLANNTIANWSPTRELLEALLAFLRDEQVYKYARGKLARDAVGHCSPTPEWVEGVLVFLRDEQVDVGIRGKLASSAGAHWSSTPEWEAAVWVFLRDEQVDGYVRGKLASSAVGHWSPTPALVAVVWAFLRDEQVDTAIRVELARGAVGHWSPTLEWVKAVWTLFLDEQVDRYVRVELASGAVARLSPTRELLEAVLVFLQDEQVDKYARVELARGAVAHLSPTPELEAAVWAFLQDEQVDRYVRVELASGAVARLSPTRELLEAVLVFLQDEQVDKYVRGKLARGAVAHLSPTPELEAAVWAFLRDEQVHGGVRGQLAIGAVAHWPPTPESEAAVWAFLRDEKVHCSFRGNLASSAVAYWSSTPEWKAALWAFLRDEQEDEYVRVMLASGAVAHGPPTPEWEEMVLAFLRDGQVAGDVRGKLASSVGAHWSPTPGWEEMVLAFLRDGQVAGDVRVNLASSVGAHWSPTPEWVEAVLAFLRDEQVAGVVRAKLASGAGAHWSPTPALVEAILGFLQDKKANKDVRYALTSVIQQWSKWPNKAQAFLGSLFVKNSYRRYVYWCADIPVHLLLPLYKKIHNKGRQYIRKQLVKHRVVVYEQAGTLLVRQAGQTERLELSESTIQQIKQDLKSYHLTFDVPVSALFRQRFFATSRTTNTSSSQRTKGKQTRREECTIT